MRALIAPILSTTWCSFIVNFNHFGGWIVVVLCDFNLKFPMTTEIKRLFTCLLVICVSSFVKCPFKAFAHFSTDCLLFSYLFVEILDSFWMSLQFHIYIADTFSFYGFPFHFLNRAFQRTDILNFNVV